MNSAPVIIFMGTPDFAVASLDALLSDGYPVAMVVTSPDKPAGRGLKPTSTAVKKYALEKGLKLLQPEKLRDPEFLSTLENSKPDIIVVVAFRMLPREVWSMARIGTFNLHASLLPQYRGAAPINHAIINGEKQTGCTTFLIDEKTDTGSILLQEACDILSEDDAGSLHDRLMINGSKLVSKTISGLLSNTLHPVPQSQLINDALPLNTAPKIKKTDCRIKWNQTGENILNFIRGLSPYPAAFTMIKRGQEPSLNLKIYKAYFSSSDKPEPGKLIISNGQLKIGCADGFIVLEEVLLQGKKRMDTASLLRGFSFQDFHLPAF